ncbi:MaoC/PaaZ C-terminal domain-containing protein [Verrucosispora sp. WMMD1129]|uniref:MaoC/PaaZ C-terminal domain-containing protein n=1 Tax=Verrucosispora sp. WMMD1129 TaxID=3016093 RepID=UPI00249CC899|nr:MaoC/PaaZ C-terminal domain-containing protein [Verrucosispora sp. WMMD1129]WFE47982.1 MaoC/PaaZ C-terminal domain-containing protein [Verrucosispora sp. WMMD1129]
MASRLCAPNCYPRTTTERTWTVTDTILYALGVGAGQADPADELRFTTENSTGHRHAALPTFATLLAAEPPYLGEPAVVRHAGETLTLHRPLPPAGRARTTASVTGVYDQDRGALVHHRSEIHGVDGAPLATVERAMFVIGAGRFGGQRAPVTTWERPAGQPDHTGHHQIRADQALLYRLSGDRNPLHSDPAVARAAGLRGSVLHGLCTYGFVARTLLHAVADGDPDRIHRISARFSAPLFPGDTLSVLVWRRPGGALFQAVDGQGRLVLDRGALELHRRPA